MRTPIDVTNPGCVNAGDEGFGGVPKDVTEGQEVADQAFGNGLPKNTNGAGFTPDSIRPSAKPQHS